MFNDDTDEADALLHEILTSGVLSPEMGAKVKQYLFPTWITPPAGPHYGESPVAALVRHYAPVYEHEAIIAQARGRMLRACMEKSKQKEQE